MFKKFIHLILLIVFVSWLVPISTMSTQKVGPNSTLCGGKRIVCLCEQSFIEIGGKVMYNYGMNVDSYQPGFQTSVQSFDSANTPLFFELPEFYSSIHESVFFKDRFFSFLSSYVRLIEHVPKISLSS